MGKILGIDLGTTTSLMAVMEKDKPVIIPNNLGERITPSVVCFTKSGEILVGKKAKKAAIMNIDRTIFSIKRHMGTDYRVKVDGKDYTPQEISSIILRKLKHDAEEFFGEEVDGKVSVALEDAHFAHVFQGNAACGKVGYAAVVKLDARIGNVGSVTDHRDTTC